VIVDATTRAGRRHVGREHPVADQAVRNLVAIAGCTLAEALPTVTTSQPWHRLAANEADRAGTCCRHGAALADLRVRTTIAEAGRVSGRLKECAGSGGGDLPMARIYYVGDWAVLLGPHFAETPFYHAPKGLEIFNYGTWLTNACSRAASTRSLRSRLDFYKLRQAVTSNPRGVRRPGVQRRGRETLPACAELLRS